MDNQKIILDYLQGKHTMYSQQEFETMLKNDPKLMSEFEHEKKMYDMILTGNIYQRLEKLYEKDRKKSAKASKPMLSIWKVAAMILALFCIAFLVKEFLIDKSKLYETYYAPAPGLPVLMGEGEDHLLEKAMVEYKMEEYSKSEAQFLSLYKKRNTDTLAYYIAQSALAQGDIEQAQSFLDRIGKESSFYEDAQWYKSLILIHQNKKIEAVDKLKSTKWNTLSDKADELLRAIEG